VTWSRGRVDEVTYVVARMGRSTGPGGTRGAADEVTGAS